MEKLFIAQRGEIAYRAAKTCEARGLSAVIPYTFSDSNPLASELVALHTGWELAILGGIRAEQNFANPKKLLETMQLHGCDGIFLGYGFLAEDVSFIRMCEEAGIRVLAPPSQVMELIGNKISAREVARKVKIGRWSTIPILEGSEDLKDLEQAHKAAEKLGFPVMLKDPDLGGGVGNIVARNERELENAYKELKTRPENRQLFLERLVQNAVHVEVQIVADQHGNVVSLGERDCTMQRRFQKVIEESPSPQISDKMSQVLQMSAVRSAKAVNYQGVGTWEFLVDLDRKGRGGDPAWYFIEVNPRIQVEHPVTEEQTGIDIVSLWIDIAEGKPLPFTQADIKPQGHTIEARVYAESPDRNFERSSGTVSILRYPQVDGVRIDPALREGDSLSPWYDHTLFKAISHGPDRETARERLLRLLAGTEIVGVSSNLHFLTELLNTPQFIEGKATTAFVEQWWSQRLKDKVHSIGDFINGGTINLQTPTSEFDPSRLPQDVTVLRRDGRSVSYSQYLESIKEQTGRTSAAEYGIVERDGVQFVLFDLDFSVKNGVLGEEEGDVFVDACKLAHEKGLPLITISRSGGASQWENVLALFQMGKTVAALNRFPPKFTVNVYSGGAYGGVPASFAGYADLQIAVDSPDTKIGFSGPYIVAKDRGLNPASFRAQDAYAVLPDGTHTPLTHYQNRVVHILVGSLEEASDKIVHLIHNLDLKEAIIDKTRVYQPREHLTVRESSGKASRFDRPGIYSSGWFGRLGGYLRDRLTHSSRDTGGTRPISVAEKLRIIVHPDRPTAADLLDTELKLFDDTVLLSNPPLHFEGVEQYLPIIAASARIRDRHLLILAQQTQRVWDEQQQKMIKKYVPQRPEDFEYAMHMLEVGEKLRLPLLLLADTNGADPSPEAESRNQSHKIAQFLGKSDQYPYPMLSVLLGLKGSGGGETFARPFDAAADAQNALSFVSTPVVQYWIMSGKWLAEQDPELQKYIEQLKDSTAEMRVKMGMIDDVISEGSGGAHLNPLSFASNLREWVLNSLTVLEGLSQSQLKDRRWGRIERVSDYHRIPRL